MGELRPLVLRWVAIFLMLASLAVSVPRHAGPDEPAHATRAAGLVRGDVFGQASEVGSAYREFGAPTWVVQPDPACFAFRSDEPAQCSLVDVAQLTGHPVSSAASYPVFGHLLPGLATLVPGQARTLWLARLIGAAWCAALLAGAFALAATWRSGSMTASTMLALTPAALFSMVVINPSGPTVAGAVAASVALLGVVRGIDGASHLFTVGFGSLALSRSDGWLWAVVVCGVVLLVLASSPRDVWRVLGRWQRSAIVASLVLSSGWAVAVRPELVHVPTDARGFELLRATLARTSTHVDEAVGLFGWADTRIPALASYGWWSALGAIATLAAFGGRMRAVRVVALSLVAFVVIGWLADFASGPSVGLVWQGRYALPLLIAGVVALGFEGVEPDTDDPRGAIVRRVVIWGVVALWCLGFAQALRRWSVGSTGDIFPWRWERGASLLHPAVALAIFVGGACWLALMQLSEFREPEPNHSGDAAGRTRDRPISW